MRKRPNFLLVMTDQQRADSVGYAHEKGGVGRGARTRRISTPSLTEGSYSTTHTVPPPSAFPRGSALPTGIFDERLPRLMAASR